MTPSKLPRVGHHRFLTAVVAILALVAAAYAFSLDGLPQPVQIFVLAGIILVGTFGSIKVEDLLGG